MEENEGQDEENQTPEQSFDNGENISSHLTANSQVGSNPPAALQGQYQSSQGESSREGELTNDVIKQNLLNLVPPALAPLQLPCQQCNSVVAPAVDQARHRTNQTYTVTLRAHLGDNIPLGLTKLGYILQQPVQASHSLSHQQVYSQVSYCPPLHVNSAMEQQEGQEEEDVNKEENQIPVESFQDIGANLPRPGKFPSHSSSPPSDYEENISSRLAAANLQVGSVSRAGQHAQYHSSRGESSKEGEGMKVTVTEDFVTLVPPAEPIWCRSCQQSTMRNYYSQGPNNAGYDDGLQVPPLRQQGSGLPLTVVAAVEDALMREWQRADETAYMPALQAHLGYHMPMALIESGYTLQPSRLISHQQLYGRFGYRPPLQVNSARRPPPFSQPPPAPPGYNTYMDIPPESLECYNQMGSVNFAQRPPPFSQQPHAPGYNTYMDKPPERFEYCNLMSSMDFAQGPPPSLSQPHPAPSYYSTCMGMPSLLVDYHQRGSMNFVQRPPPLSPFSQPRPAAPCYSTSEGMHSQLRDYHQRGLMNFAQRPPLPPFPQPLPVPPRNSTSTGIPPLLGDYHQRGSMNFAQRPPPRRPFPRPLPAPPADSTSVAIPPLLKDYDAGHSKR